MSIALLNPFWYAAPAGFTRTYFDSGITTTPVEVTTIQTSRASITTTEATNDRFATFWQSINQNNNVAADQIALLNESPTERQRFNIESQDATDQHSMGGAYAYTGGTSRTLTLDSLEEAAGAGNEIQDYGLCALKLVTEDAFEHSSGQTDSSSTTYATKASVTVGAGTWLIVASCSILQSVAGNAKVRVFDGTTALTEQSATFFAQDTTNWVPFNFINRVTPGASTTYSLQIGRVGVTGTASIRQATIVALDLSKFDNTYYAEQFTAQNTTTTTAFGADALSNAFTIANPSNKHLLLASAVCASSATNRSTQARLFNTTASVSYSGTSLREANAALERYDIFVGRIVTFESASQTIAWQHNIAGGAGTSTLDEMTIAILDLGTSV